MSITRAQPIYFNNAHDYGLAELFSSTLPVDDGYITVGFGSWPGTLRTVIVSKCDDNGNEIWNKQFADSILAMEPRWVLRHEGQTVLSGGHTRSSVTGDYNHLLFRCNHLGDTLWWRMWGDTAIDEYVMDARPTHDGNYILLAAHDYDVAPLWGQSALIKTDPDGNILWTYEYGESNYYNVPYQVVETRDSGFMIVGYRSDQFGGNRDLMLIKTDSEGNHEWTKYYGGVLDDWGGAIAESMEGGYLAGGYRETIDDFEYKGWLLKVDEDGIMEWESFYSHDPWIDNGFWQRLIQLKDGSYVMLGWAEMNTGRDLGLIAKIDCHGNRLWSRTYTRDSTRNHYFYGMDTTSDGGFIVCGSTFLQGQNQDAWLLKLDEYGCDTPGCHLNDTAMGVPCFTAVPHGPPTGGESIAIFPNPNDGTFVAQLPGDEVWLVQLLDLSGRLVQQRRLKGSATWDVAHLAKGLYLLRATCNDGTTATVKVAIE